MDSSLSKVRTGLRGRVAVSVVTAVLFLLCHGLLGASHTVGLAALPDDEPGGGSHAVHHGADAHGPSHQGSEAPSHGDHGFAYATVLAVGLALLALALPAFVAIFSRIESVEPRGRGGVSGWFSPVSCRGPTLPVLQVFRL